MKLALAFLLILVLIVCSACAKAPEPPPETTEGEAPPPAAIAPEDVEAARQVVFAYLEALNNYDVEGALALLEESWREQREASITSEIGQMETFGVTLGVEEEAEPVITPEGTVQIKMKLTPSKLAGPRHVTYHLTKIDGEWKIYFAE